MTLPRAMVRLDPDASSPTDSHLLGDLLGLPTDNVAEALDLRGDDDVEITLPKDGDSDAIEVKYRTP